MSETLRAIMSDLATYRSPTFYSCAVNTVSTITGAKSFGRRTGIIPCKADCYFLAMGAAQFSSFTGGNLVQGWGGKAEASTFQIQRASNFQPFSSFPMVKSNQNFNLNGWSTWSEYILFKPSESINIIEDVQVTDVAAVNTHTTTVVLMGVEYRFPG